MCAAKAVDCVPFSTVQGNILNILRHSSNGISYDSLLNTYKHFYANELDYQSYGFESLAECLEDVPGLKPVYVDGIMKVTLSVPSEFLSSKGDAAYTLFEKIKNAEDENSVYSKDENSAYPEIDEGLKENFKILLQQYPRGIFCRDFPVKYKEFFDEEFDLSETGYYNLIDLVNDIPDICIRIQPDGCQSDWLLYPATRMSSEHLLQNFAQNKDETYSNNELIQIISTIRRILQAHPDGILLSDFDSVYGMNCEIPLNIYKTGSLTTFFEEIMDKVPLIFENTNRGVKVVYAHYESHPEPFVDNSQLPPNIVLPGMEYRQQMLPNLERDTFFPVHVGWIQSPSELYVQLDDSSSEALLELASELQFYAIASKANLLAMHAQHVVPNTPCAAMWTDGGWYRSKIIKVENVQVEVQFVDYGNTEIVLRKHLKYLKTCHFALPAQAIRTRLFYTRPDNVWAQSDRINKIPELFSNSKKFLASVVPSQICPEIPSIILCEAENPDSCLNILLVQKGLAISFEEHLEDTNVSTNEVLPSEENDANEMFGSDDDEAFDEMCQKFDCVRRYVQRVYLSDDYVIHIVSFEEKLHIPDCDIVKLFWSNESGTTLQRRLRQCDIYLPYKIIFESDYPNLFSQLQCYEISGIKDIHKKTAISLYFLQDLISILNTFGHPSSSIRYEINRAIKQYNPTSTFWQSFTEPRESEKRKEIEKKWKFERLCLYDLHTILEGLKFKRIKDMRTLKNRIERQNQDVMWNEQIEKHKRRIGEIEELCHAL